jgi:hypothetical protein
MFSDHSMYCQKKSNLGSAWVFGLLFGIFVSSVSSVSFAQVQNQTFIFFEQSQYAVGPAFETQKSSYTQGAIGHQLFSGGKEGWVFRDDVTVSIPASEGSELGFVIPDLYLGYKAEPAAVFIGRKRMNWSELDSIYKLGLWQPLVRWDAADPISEGLTGAFLSFEHGYFKLTGFASFLYFPDQQANFELKDGDINSDNRWFRAPISEIELLEQTEDIYYELDRPAVTDVIIRESFAGSLLIGGPRDGFYARGSLARKPANQFHLGIETQGAASSLQDLRPIIHPIVVRHDIFTGEGGYGNDDFRVFVSYTRERFRDPFLPDDWEETELKDSDTIGFHAESLVDWGMGWVPKASVRTGLIAVEHLPKTEQSTFVEGEISSSTERFLFEQIFVLGGNVIWPRIAGLKIVTDGQYMRSVGDNGEWVSLSTEIHTRDNWSFRLQADVFGVPEETPTNTSFISMFRGNDRVEASVKYVF